MFRKPVSKRTRLKLRAVLRLPDLDQAKSAVLNSLTFADAQRGYRHAIEEFLEWYPSNSLLNQSGTGTVRTWPPLPTKSTMAQCFLPLLKMIHRQCDGFVSS
jgi:hypothetical protein